MKLFNNGEEFTMAYNGQDYTIPAGEMEVNNDFLGMHIIEIARKWGMDVKRTEATKISVKPSIAPIAPVAPVAPAKEETPETEEKVEVAEKKETKTTKTK